MHLSTRGTPGRIQRRRFHPSTGVWQRSGELGAFPTLRLNRGAFRDVFMALQRLHDVTLTEGALDRCSVRRCHVCGTEGELWECARIPWPFGVAELGFEGMLQDHVWSLWATMTQGPYCSHIDCRSTGNQYKWWDGIEFSPGKQSSIELFQCLQQPYWFRRIGQKNYTLYNDIF